ncbi:Osc7112_2153 family protein [Microcoleus sp.]|uniref:Osc7112_2153 family protein n=1 Tax=Microcoleus sp. TaxID=44472 RepID=UPI003526AE29
MKPNVLISSTILAIITLVDLSPASQALPSPVTVKSTVNHEVELFTSSYSRRPCRDTDGGQYVCPRLIIPQDSAE